MGQGRTVTALSAFSQASQTTWASLPPELLRDIITRVESGHGEWPSRRSVVACACVCRAWRDLTRDITRASNPEPSGRLTFPEDLRQPGPRDRCVECFIKRNRKTGTFTLFLGLPPTPTETGKFLMAARKCGWRPSSMEYVVSLDPRDFSRSGSGYLGRLRANFLSTRFTIFDSSTAMASAQHQQQQQQASSATATQCSSGSSKVHPGGSSPSPSKSSSSSGQVGGSAAGSSSSSSSAPPPSPAVSVAYALNVLGTRGPRRIQCVLHNVPSCPNTPTPAAAAGAGGGPKTRVPIAMSSLAAETGSLAGSSRMSAGGGSSASLRLSEDAADTASSVPGSSFRESTGLLPVAPTSGRESSYEDDGSTVPGGIEEVDGARARGSSGSLDGASGGAASGLAAAVADCSVSHTGEECDCRECLGSGPAEPMVLKNKPPRWHDQLQCWCLNFRGRVTVASVKNFQLVDGGAPGNDSDKPVLLQFGKIGKDTFTMDYQFPLSAFQAFAICLSSFDTKVACE